MTRINCCLDDASASQRPLRLPDPRLAGRRSLSQSPASALTRISRREIRVFLALALIWSLSMLDLGLTMAMTVTAGMFESNPLARGIVRSTNSPYSLVAWKIICTGICTAILLWLRRRRSAEMTAWLGVAALCTTTVVWVLYLGAIHPSPTEAPSSATERVLGTWMTTRKFSADTQLPAARNRPVTVPAAPAAHADNRADAADHAGETHQPPSQPSGEVLDE